MIVQHVICNSLYAAYLDTYEFATFALFEQYLFQSCHPYIIPVLMRVSVVNMLSKIYAWRVLLCPAIDLRISKLQCLVPSATDEESTSIYQLMMGWAMV